MKAVTKFLTASAAAVSLLAGASSANAAVVFNLINLTGPGTDFFGADITDEPGAFSHNFNFTLTDPGQANSVVTTIELQGNVINLSSIFLDGFAFTKVLDTGVSEFWQRSAVTLGAGPHTITVNGSVDGATQDGSYSGVINIAAIPEPGTWALMIMGFGGAGAMIRSRRRAAVAI